MAIQDIEIVADQFATRVEKIQREQLLRDYQQEAVNNTILGWSLGQSGYVLSHTGSGKTTIMAQLVKQTLNPETQRALMLTTQLSGLDQVRERVENQCAIFPVAYWQGTPKAAKTIGVVQADRNDVNARIIVGMRQSLSPKRLEEVLKHGKIDQIYIDECHHCSPQNNYDRIVKRLKQVNPDLKVVGFTATMERSDGLSLGSVFEAEFFSYPLTTGISNGSAVNVVRQVVETEIDLTPYKIATRKGDYVEHDLIAALDANNWPERAADAYMKYVKDSGRITAAFFPSVNQSKKFVAILNELGIPAEHIDGTTEKSIRFGHDGIESRFKRGLIPVVSNCAVFTESFDAPLVSCILMARPTKSATLFTQVVGRGTRLYPGKKDCLLVDLTVVDTKILTTGTLLGKTLVCTECKTEYLKAAKPMPCPVCGFVFEEKKKESNSGGGKPDIDQHSKKSYIGTIFQDLSGFWHKGANEIYSLSLGFERQRDGKTKSFGGLVIYPPSLEDTSELKSRLEKGMSAVESSADENQKYRYIQKIKHIQRMIARCDSYCLYHVDGKGVVEYLKANRDLQSLIIEADREAIRKSGKSIAKQGIDRNAKWREGEVSAPQLNLAKQLGIEGAATMSKGDLSATINHVKTTPAVERWIQEDRV